MRLPADAQSYREQRPAPALAGLVACAWIQRVGPAAPSYTHRFVPNGSVELECRIGSIPRVVGPRTGPRVRMLAPGTTVVGVRFLPSAAGPVLGMPASELVDVVRPADELWGRSAVALSERIAAAVSPEAALAALQAQVAAWRAQAALPDPMVTEAVQRLMPWRTEEIGSLTASLYVSERQLRRRCLAEIGVAPKVLQRILRFQGFLALTQFAMSRGRAPGADGLARLAADAGYADQSHLTRECLRLSGLSPRAFLAESLYQCGPGHDHSVSYTPLLGARA